MIAGVAVAIVPAAAVWTVSQIAGARLAGRAFTVAAWAMAVGTVAGMVTILPLVYGGAA